MKKMFFLSALLTLVSIFSYAQKAFDTTGKYFIDYNFANGVLTPLTPFIKPEVYKPVVIRIRNINRTIYKIRVEVKDSILASSEPQGILAQITGFKTTSLPTTSTPRDIEKAADGKKDDSLDVSKDKTKQKVAKRAVNTFISKSKAPDPIKARQSVETLLNSNSFSFILPDETKPTLSKEDKTYEYTEKVKDVKASKGKRKKITEKKIVTNNNLNSEEQKSAESAAQLKITYEYIIQILNDTIAKCNEDIRELATLQGILKNELLTYQNEDAFINTKQSLATLASLKNKLNIIEAQHIVADYLSIQLKEVLSDTLINKKNRAVLSAYQGYLDTTIARLKTEDKFKQINAAISALLSMAHEEFFTFISAPFIPFGDMVTFKVIIESADSASLTIDNRKTFELPIFTKHRFRFDFSTGLSFVGGLSNHVYRTTPYLTDANTLESTDSLRVQENPRNEKLKPIVCAFIHGGFDIGKQWKPLITLGASLNTENFDISTIVLGMGAMLGRADRLIISGGLAFKKTSVIDPKYQVGKAYKKANFANQEVPVLDQFKTGWFFSVSYNLTQKQKKQ